MQHYPQCIVQGDSIQSYKNYYNEAKAYFVKWSKREHTRVVCGEYDMRNFIVDSWNGVMDYRFNPLKHIPDLQVRHMMLQVLAWLWCIAFSLYFASWGVFGITVVSHFILILAIVVTVATFKVSEKCL